MLEETFEPESTSSPKYLKNVSSPQKLSKKKLIKVIYDRQNDKIGNIQHAYQLKKLDLQYITKGQVQKMIDKLDKILTDIFYEDGWIKEQI